MTTPLTQRLALMDVLQQHSHHFQHTPQWYEKAYRGGPSRVPPIVLSPQTQRSSSISNHGTFRQRVHEMRVRERSAPGPSFMPMAVPVQPTAAAPDRNIEHMLRRKTPNGTLTDGYDGRPSGQTVQNHVDKHFVVHAPNTEKPADNQYSAMASSRDGSLRRRNIYTNPPPWPLSQHLMSPATHSGVPLAKAQIQEHCFGNSASRSSPLSAGMDSVLYQQPYAHPGSEFLSGQYVPTALQPMWPPLSGATSMNKPVPDSPYWPSVAYKPHRPLHCPDTGRKHRPFDDSYSIEGSQVSDVLPTNPADHDFSNCFLTSSSHDRLDQGVMNPQQTHDPTIHFGEQLPLSQGICEANSIGACADAIVPNKSAEATMVRPSIVEHEDHRLPTEVQFKGRVLLWAHRIYHNLLSTLDQAPKFSPVSESPTQHRCCYQPRSHSKPYECQSGPQFSRKSYNGQIQSQNRRRSSDAHRARISGESQSLQHLDDHDSSAPIQTLPYRVRNLSLGRQPHSERWEQAATTAVTAIEMLNRLCQESDWKWSEGMLLGGCLAYGLGDFHSAHQWYSKLLLLDTK